MSASHRGAVLTALTCLGMWACTGTEQEEASATVEGPAAEDFAALSGGGSVELEPNVLRGMARLTNQNPRILELLATDNTWNRGYTVATSTRPGGFTANTPVLPLENPTEVPFEMLVEAGAGGTAGVVYTVTVRRGTGTNFYTFPPITGVQVRPRSVQPEPTVVSVEGCIGVVQFQVGTDATCQTPVAVSSFNATNIPSMTTFPTYARNGLYVGYLPGGTTRQLSANFRVSTPTGQWLQRQVVTVTAACDQVVRQCIVADSSSPPPVGGVTGPFELLNENIRSTTLTLSGPSDRSGPLRPPVAPVGEPGTWWKLENLIEGTYTMRAQVGLRSGREFTLINLPFLEGNTVNGGPLTSLTKVVEGEVRYPYAIQPAHFYGSIRLADPFVPQHPGTYSSMESLIFGADNDTNGDGIPNSVSINNWTHLNAYTPRASSGEDNTYTAFPGAFDPDTGELASAYDLVLANPYDIPRTWTQEGVRLRFSSEGHVVTTRPGMYDPAKFRYGLLAINQRRRSAVLGPDARFRVDHEYCLNEVQVQYDTLFGSFFNPGANVHGNFKGTDWRSLPADYSVSATFWGTPAVWNMPNAHQYAQTSGSLTMVLPQGSYTVTPRATMVSTSGETNEALFAPLSVMLGCGQRLKLVPPLSVIVNPVPGCATGAQVPVTGVVKSSPAVVDRIWYQVNGGPEVTLCTNCGSDPGFAFQAQLQACENDIQVFAFSEGLSQPAFGTVQAVWDEPADGPSCPGTYCVNRPPVALCRSVSVPVDSACSQGTGSVNEGSYDPDTGDTVTCVQTPGGPYAVGTNRVKLTCTDSVGLSSSCEATVTVRDMTPPQVVCPEATQLQCANGGALATYAVSATDNCGGTPSVACSPAPGSTLPMGNTAVTCTAADAAGNRASCSFPVEVVDTQAPTLSLVGDEELVLGCGQAPATGVVATDGCTGELTSQVEALGLDMSKPGTYSVSYRVSDTAGNTAQVGPRPVTVLGPGEPSLSLRGNSAMTLECGVDTWVDPGATATDGCSVLQVHKYNSGDDDGDGVPGGQDPDDHGPGPDTSAEGSYPVQYLAWNATGVTLSAIRTVHVNDSRAPTLSLQGAVRMTHTCGSAWVDPGVAAIDACYGDVSPSVQKAGYVNGWAEGTYTLTYTLTDSGGNSAPPVMRTVEVVDCPW